METIFYFVLTVLMMVIIIAILIKIISDEQRRQFQERIRAILLNIPYNTNWKSWGKDEFYEFYKSKVSLWDNKQKNYNNQYNSINQCEFETFPPLNNEANNVYWNLICWARERNTKWDISFEVCMGSFIQIKDSLSKELEETARNSFNSKRVDFLLTDKYRIPKVAIEYNGTGHYGNNNEMQEDTAHRMRIKKIILDKVNIPLITFEANASKADIYTKMDKVYRVIQA